MRVPLLCIGVLAFAMLFFTGINYAVSGPPGYRITLNASEASNYSVFVLECIPPEMVNARLSNVSNAFKTLSDSNPALAKLSNFSLKDSSEQCVWTYKIGYSGDCESCMPMSAWHNAPDLFLISTMENKLREKPFRLLFYDSAGAIHLTEKINHDTYGDRYSTSLNAVIASDGSVHLQLDKYQVYDTGYSVLKTFYMIAIPAVVLEMISGVLIAWRFFPKASIKRMAISIAVANVIILPCVVFFNGLMSGYIIAFEVIAIFIEAGVIYLLSDKKLTIKESLIISTASNIVMVVFVLFGLIGLNWWV